MTDPAEVYDSWFVPVLFAPVAEQMVAGTALPPQARVRVRDVLYEVEGEPGDWHSPFTGWRPGIEVALVRAQ